MSLPPASGLFTDPLAQATPPVPAEPPAPAVAANLFSHPMPGTGPAGREEADWAYGTPASKPGARRRPRRS